MVLKAFRSDKETTRTNVSAPLSVCLVGACAQGGQTYVAVYVNTRGQVQHKAQGSQPPYSVHP